jgi:hypothetical protein
VLKTGGEAWQQDQEGWDRFESRQIPGKQAWICSADYERFYGPGTNPSRDYGRHDVRTGAEEFMELRVRELLVELF